MGDLLINFDANQNEKTTSNESDQLSASLADSSVDRSTDLLTNDPPTNPTNSDGLIDNNSATDWPSDKPSDEKQNEKQNHLDRNSLEEKADEHDSIESRDSEKKKVLQELNQRIIDEQKLNSELVSKLHIQLDNAITEKEDLVRKLTEKESDLSEVESMLKQQKERLKQLEEVESTNSKLKALAVKLKKELAELKENVSGTLNVLNGSHCGYLTNR